jgi:U6 snRNA-associated Sm-like protein LSm7
MADLQSSNIIEQQKPVEEIQQQQQQQQNQSQGQGQGQGQNQQRNQNQRQQKKNTYAPKRGPIIDLEPILNKEVNVRLVSGRNILGTLTGYDQLLNIVIENATVTTPESVTYDGTEDASKLDKVVVIGRMILAFQPMDGYEIIENPNVQFDFVI